MAHIYIYSPSGAVRDKAAFKRGVARLKQLGHEVELDADALSSHTRFAGDDATRLAAIHRAADSGADVALISRGGYGLTRILPGIKYKQVAKDFGQEQPDDIMEACFDDMVSGQGEGAGWQFSKACAVANEKRRTSVWAHDAVLWGGNLAVLVSLLGTPYFPQIKNGVLFLEDVGEHPYRVERMLTQLLHAGVLAQQKAVVFGQFSNYKLTPHDKGFKLQSVVDLLRTQIKVPEYRPNCVYPSVKT